MRELIVVTGSKGSGKSTALATLAPPGTEGRVFVIDTENSMSDIVGQVKFGKYIRAHEQYSTDEKMLHDIAIGKLPWVSTDQRNALVGFYDWIVEILDKELKAGKFDTVLIDTIEPLEAAMAAAVDFGKKKFGWSGSRAYGKMEVEGVRPLYENFFEAIYARGVKQIAVSTHIKRVWEDDKPILNKIKPGGRLMVLSRLSSLMLWLVPNVGNPDGAPAALVLKARKGRMIAVDGEWEVRRVLPQRIPHFTWADVKRYENHPADLANPSPGEVPTDGEHDMISEMLTDEQMKLMVVGAQLELEMAKQDPVIGAVPPNEGPSEELKSEVLKLSKDGIPYPMIAKQVGMPLPQVVKIIQDN